MEIIFVRHFPTPGNHRRAYIGSTDEPLDMDGVKVGVYPEVTCVVASPMKRCIETAKLIYPDKSILLCDEMRECDFGMFEGKNYEELKEEPAYQEWLDSGGMKPFPGGESRIEFQERCVQGFEKMFLQLASKGCQKVAFIVHGGTIMAVLGKYDKEKRDFYQFQVANGEGYRTFADEKAWEKGEKHLTQIQRL